MRSIPEVAPHQWAIDVAVLMIWLAGFDYLCRYLRGALFNPTNCVSLVVSGKGRMTDNLMRMVGAGPVSPSC